MLVYAFYAVSCWLTGLGCADTSVPSLDTGMLYPRTSESRQIQELNGMWHFRADMSWSRHASFEERWFARPLSETGDVIAMPVPSSFNDITANKALRDFVGWVWYDREFYVATNWQSERVVLRVDSAHYNSILYVNGEQVVQHSGGHLPFEAVVNTQLRFGAANRVTIALNNTLTPSTLPCGSVTNHTGNPSYPPYYYIQNVQFDFFNYAGIHRSVSLYTTPKLYVDDITITTSIQATTGHVNYHVTLRGGTAASVLVEVVNRNGSTVASSEKLSDVISVQNAHLWWPWTMSSEYGYLYTLKVTTQATDGASDVYRQPFGIRTVSLSTTQILINDKPFYCQGFGKHEDYETRGKGLDMASIARDFAMIRWLGANCFRTSHYPYAEELLDQADVQGIAVILESPAIGLYSQNYLKATLQHHLTVMSEMVRRDKNRACVIMWSVANEPHASHPAAGPYFKSVINHTKSLDSTRPVTIVTGGTEPNTDYAVPYADVTCINRYYGWYSDTGHSEVIGLQMTADLHRWYRKYPRPLIVTEYGADTLAGLHTMPSFIFTEEYQVEYLLQHHHVFDHFRCSFLAGEMVWNFADFMTNEMINRVVGNKKGILTRSRQPKAAAHLIRRRYWSLLNHTAPFPPLP